VATPFATEPETHTQFVGEPYCVFPVTCFCSRSTESNNLSSWAQPADFYGCFSPNPYGEIEGKILLGGGCDEHCLRGIAGPPVSSAVSSLTPPLKTLGEDHISGPSRHGGRGLEISPKGGWTFMASQRVPETPQEINEWLKGTISVPELLLMSF